MSKEEEEVIKFADMAKKYLSKFEARKQLGMVYALMMAMLVACKKEDKEVFRASLGVYMEGLLRLAKDTKDAK